MISSSEEPDAVAIFDHLLSDGIIAVFQVLTPSILVTVLVETTEIDYITVKLDMVV